VCCKSMETRLRILILLLLIPALAYSYTVVRKDGKVFSGELVSESQDEIIIKDKDHVTIKFKKHQVDWDKTTSERQKEDQENSTTTLPERREIETSRTTKEWTGEKISVDFKDIDIRDLFRFLAETGGVNLILDPSVKGTVTVKMTDVPWDQVLDLVCRMHNLGYEIDGKVVNVKN
jgi:type II secretory pathway component HofQ